MLLCQPPIRTTEEEKEGGGNVNMTESGAQLFARLDGRQSVRDIEPRLFPQNAQPGPGAVVELYGTEGTGKTELLYHFLCRAVLPVHAGGLELEVLFVDTDYSLDVLRLVGILDARLLAAAAESSIWPQRPEAHVRACLSRLLVAHCDSSRQLLVTLHTLEARLVSRPGPALVLLDSASAFYWSDRGEGGASVSKQEENLRKCSQLLAALLRDYRISVFASCHANRRRCGHASSSFSHLCRPWQRLVTHRVLCSRQEVAPARGGPRGHVFSAHCTSSSSGGKAYRNCSFRIGDGGLEFV
ncbi:DNA repair protein XRCC2 isoform X1 [Hippocampus comes]|uniref:X-ray repair cross complementing 2 n=1 Tax=Hippocampus comes TaxID=109280 RepID=A0A3Q2XP59_HIPCM|nr:PREDICTED: DNA repair protein XRCC2 isoform X1 [Hippocampus comes]